MYEMHYGYTQRLASQCPCKDCKDRHAECHASCEPYLAYEKERLALNKSMDERWKQTAALRAHEREVKQRKEKAWRQAK